MPFEQRLPLSRQRHQGRGMPVEHLRGELDESSFPEVVEIAMPAVALNARLDIVGLDHTKSAHGGKGTDL
jgi:hypothetical protein